MAEDTLNRQFRYPLAAAIPEAELAQQVEDLHRAKRRGFVRGLPTYLRLGGPGFIGAAATLGAGTMTSAMLAGAQFGYKTLWIYWVAVGSGMFMMAAMARFTCQGGFTLIDTQARLHGWFIARVLTALVGLATVCVVFNFGQVALGTHLIDSIAQIDGPGFRQGLNWPLYIVLTSWIALSYGRSRSGGTRLLENFMKWGIVAMIACFAACLFVVGIDWGAALKGTLIPWLPSGTMGIDLFIASSAAAIGVADWALFHYTGHAKGWRREHEGLARTDMVAGFFVPFFVVCFLVVSVFAATLYASGEVPTSAPELARALVPLLGEKGAQYAFMIGFLIVPVTSTIAMCIGSAIGIHEAFGWKPDVHSWRWKICLLLPQIGFLAAWYPSPVTLIIIIAAALSLTNNIVGWSLYMMLNDKKLLGESRSKSRLWNVGVMVQVTLLNCVAITYVFNRLGWWQA